MQAPGRLLQRGLCSFVLLCGWRVMGRSGVATESRGGFREPPRFGRPACVSWGSIPASTHTSELWCLRLPAAGGQRVDSRPRPLTVVPVLSGPAQGTRDSSHETGTWRVLASHCQAGGYLGMHLLIRVHGGQESPEPTALPLRWGKAGGVDGDAGRARGSWGRARWDLPADVSPEWSSVF